MTKNSNILGVKNKDYGECGFCKDSDNVVELTIEWSLWCQWQWICNKMDDKEWTGVYDVVDGKITNFRIPKQEVTSSECDLEEDLGGNGIVHSHHSMGAFHSGQDDKHCRNLYEYSIVLSNKDGYEATVRRTLPCGGFGHLKVKLLIENAPDIDISMISTEKKVKISNWKENEDFTYDGYDKECSWHNDTESKSGYPVYGYDDLDALDDEDWIYVPGVGYKLRSECSKWELNMLGYKKGM